MDGTKFAPTSHGCRAYHCVARSAVQRPGADSREIDVWVLWAEPGASDAGLQTAAQDACPARLDADTLAGMACLHWRSGL